MKKHFNIQLNEKNHTLAKLISTVKKVTLNDYFEKAIEDAIEKDKKIINRLTK